MKRWLAGLFCGLALLAGAAAAEDQPAPQPAPSPAWQVGAAEVQGERTFCNIYVNRFGTLWTEFSRSQLFRSFAQEPAVAVSSAKFLAKMQERVKAFNAGVKADDELYLFNQIGRIGPIISGWELGDAGNAQPSGVVDFRHTCDPAFLQQLNSLMAKLDDPFMGGRFLEDFTFDGRPFAHREIHGHTAVETSFGTNMLSNADHIVLYGPRLTATTLFQRFAQTPAALHQDDFAAFMGPSDHWLSAARLDLPFLFSHLPPEVGFHAADFKAIFGDIACLSMKESVNPANRFETELRYPGTDLNKGLLFFGAGAQLNPEIARIYPDELVFILHLNYDFHKLLTTDPDNLPDASAEFKKALKEMQKSVKELLMPPAADGQQAVPGPVLTHGISFLMLESDKLEEIGQSFVVVAGIEPGFKASESWVGSLSVAKNWNGEKKAIKTVTYNNTDIVVVGDANSSPTCFAVVGGALISSGSLKQLKRVVRYMNRVQSGEVDPQKSTLSAHLNSLAEKSKGGMIYGSLLLKMDYLIKTLLPTGLGAGAVMLPDLPTDVDWNAVAGRLQPASGVLMYDPAQGIQGRMVSDLPLPTLLALSATTGAMASMRDFNGFFGNHQVEEDDLQPLGGGAENEEAVPVPAVEPVAPDGAVAPDAVAPAKPEKKDKDGDEDGLGAGMEKDPAPATPEAPKTAPAPAPEPAPAPAPEPAPAQP